MTSKAEGVHWASERLPDWAWIVKAAARARLDPSGPTFGNDDSRRAAETFIVLVAREIAGP